MLLLAAKNDTCRDSEGAARRIYERRKAAGLETEAVAYMMHCWGAMEFVPEAKAVRQEYFAVLR